MMTQFSRFIQTKFLLTQEKNYFLTQKRVEFVETCNHYENNIRTGLDFFLTKEDKKKREKILDKI